MIKAKEKTLTTALILAGGSGTRMASDTTKQRINICGKSVLRRSVEAFENTDCIDRIIVVCREDEIDFAKEELLGISKLYEIVTGGNDRAESAKKGFSRIRDREGFVLIHDAARCLITEEDINAVASAAYEFGCATASAYVTDTVKTVDGLGIISKTLDRSDLRLMQTPQAFSCKLYSEALKAAEQSCISVTDDNMLLENIGVKIKTVITSRENIKITTADDVGYAEYILKKRRK